MEIKGLRLIYFYKFKLGPNPSQTADHINEGEGSSPLDYEIPKRKSKEPSTNK